jgi:hypothetical protein
MHGLAVHLLGYMDDIILDIYIAIGTEIGTIAHHALGANTKICLYYTTLVLDIKWFVFFIVFVCRKFDTEIFLCYNGNVNILLYLKIVAMITQQLQTKNASGLGNTKEYIVLHHT